MKLNIDESEVLRYLGYKDQHIDDNLKEKIYECKNIISESATPRYVYKQMDFHISSEGVKINDTYIHFPGKDILNHLSNSKKCFIMAATLGLEIEKIIKLYNKKDLTKALILDACATTAIEELCDEVESNIRELVSKNNKYINFRYSPGYGDLPVDTNKHILNLLDAQKTIGLTVTDYNILIPKKSVTAIIGVLEESEERKRSCKDCLNYGSCKFKKLENKETILEPCFK